MQKTILIIGAGRSSASLINYLDKQAKEKEWLITVADYDEEMAAQKVKDASCAEAIFFDVHDVEQRESVIERSDLVISLLPARLHHLVAVECVKMGKNMITASYVSEEMKKLHREAVDKDILLLNEMGLDPGIDHMSAMKMIEQVKEEGGHILSFESFAGGLLAGEVVGNPWHYKFTWNPRNVVLAGQGGTVKFLHNGRYKYIPYHKLFRRTEYIDIEGYGRFEAYANRDSLHYIGSYGLQGTPTVYRGTLRRPGFCRAWDSFVQIGATDNGYVMEHLEDMTYRQFINSFLAYNPHDSVELKLKYSLKLDQDSDVIEKLKWLDIFSDKKVGMKKGTPAQVLQKILEEKWTLSSEDRDMVVMLHRLGYSKNGENRMETSHMVIEGKDISRTAMADTVGLPLGIAARLILEDRISLRGVRIPVYREIYEPTLKELGELGVSFQRKDEEWNPEQKSSL